MLITYPMATVASLFILTAPTIEGFTLTHSVADHNSVRFDYEHSTYRHGDHVIELSLELFFSTFQDQGQFVTEVTLGAYNSATQRTLVSDIEDVDGLCDWVRDESQPALAAYSHEGLSDYAQHVIAQVNAGTFAPLNDKLDAVQPLAKLAGLD